MITSVITLFKLLGGPVIKAVTDTIQKRQNRKASEQQAEAKLKLAKAVQAGKVELADHEIQVLRTKGQVDSWKDEYVLILVSLPILVGTVGAIVTIWDLETGGRIMTASTRIADLMTGKYIDYAELWLMVASASMGLKYLRR